MRGPSDWPIRCTSFYGAVGGYIYISVNLQIKGLRYAIGFSNYPSPLFYLSI
jgi:hypothetical protein